MFFLELYGLSLILMYPPDSEIIEEATTKPMKASLLSSGTQTSKGTPPRAAALEYSGVLC